MSSIFSGALPDGTETDSVEEYAEAWQDMIEPLAQATGTVLIACDPGFTLAKSDWSRSVQIPRWFVKMFNERREGETRL